jgi:uncharacterized repeat protein (TIGR01451 family)
MTKLKLLFRMLAVLMLSVSGMKAEGTYEIMNRIAPGGAYTIIHLEHPGFGTGYATNLNLRRRTILRVDISNLNEKIDIYTSRFNGTTNIGVWGPGKDPEAVGPDWTFDVTNGGAGYVGTWADIVNVQSITTRPRAPATYTPTFGTGTYSVILYGENGTNGIDGNGVQFWDVMVRDDKGTPGTIDDILRSGRLFSTHIAMSGLNFNARMRSIMYMIDGEDLGTYYEGYVWRGNLNGIAPFGFHMFTNRNGSYPAAHHFRSVRQTASPTPVMQPQYQMYMNYPEKTVIEPVRPNVSNLVFISNCPGGVPTGGEFRFNTNGSWSYEIILDENNDGQYDRGTERSLSGTATNGANVIPWDGKLYNGTDAPNGQTFSVILRSKSSEIHFPFFDVENQPGAAGPLFNLMPADNSTSERYYWDDRLIPGGTFGGTGGSLTPHTWVQAIGDNAIIDTWKVAYADVAEFELGYSCTAANLGVSKSCSVARTAVGSTITWTVALLNQGPANATGIALTDVLPAQMTYVSDNKSGAYNSGTGVWTVGNLAVGAADTLRIVTTVNSGTPGQIITNTVNITAANESDPDGANNTASAQVEIGQFLLSGTVFEDIRYGGGAGRPIGTTGVQRTQSARVELYNAGTGAFIAFTTTDANGNYSFANRPAGTYYVRVASLTVKSKRVGGGGAEVAVQTFRTDASTASVTAVTNKVGGEVPVKVDAGSNVTSANFSTLTTVTTAPQSYTTVLVVDSDRTGIDFGFNFDTIVNTNDTGQGSFRQFLTNSNLLSNNGLWQDGFEQDYEASIFMIPNTDPNFASGTFTITPVTAWPNITDSRTQITSITQTAYTGNTFAAVADTWTGAEVVIRGVTNATFSALAGLTRFYDVHIRGSNGVGTNGAAVHFPDAGSFGSVIDNTTIFESNGPGIVLAANSNNITIRNSIIRNNSLGATDGSGIQLTTSTTNTIENNRILNNPGEGISLIATSNSNTITGNIIRNNGAGGSTRTAGVAVRSGSSNIINGNTIYSNTGDGVLVSSTGTANTIRGNSTYTNGNLGIDLGAGDQGDGVTINDNNDADAGPNNLLNFPVLDMAEIDNGTLVITGWARPGAIVEFFIRDNDAGNFGEGQTFVFFAQEGSGSDLDATTGAYSNPVNGLNQGADNTNRFRFEIPVPGGVSVGQFLTSTATDALGNTSEFSGRVEIKPAYPDIRGRVYSDLNHNGVYEGNEAGTGQTLYVKLVPTASPSGPAVRVATANTTTGEYSMLGVDPGSYFLILDNNNTLADVTSTIPAGWLGTQPDNFRINDVVITTFDRNALHFGLYQGSKLSGRVFEDNGLGGGTANNGVRDGGEAGLGGSVLRATNNTFSTTYDEVVSDPDGYFTLWIPFSAGASQIIVTETNNSAYISTGGSAGSTGGSYDRVSDRVFFNNTVGQSYTGLAYGNVQANRFDPNNERIALPGTTVFLTHQFYSGTAGTVSFALSGVNAPSVPGWAYLIYRDANANGQIDAGENQVTTPIAATAGQTLHFVVRVTVPAVAPVGASTLLTITSTFLYTNASPALNGTYQVRDLVKVNDGEGAGLQLVKTVDKTTAKPGETLVYTLTYTNLSTDPLSQVVIKDATPAYTTFESAVFGPLAPSFSGCAIAAPSIGSGGAITWTFTGPLNSGGTGYVRYTVRIEE